MIFQDLATALGIENNTLRRYFSKHQWSIRRPADIQQFLKTRFTKRKTRAKRPYQTAAHLKKWQFVAQARPATAAAEIEKIQILEGKLAASERKKMAVERRTKVEKMAAQEKMVSLETKLAEKEKVIAAKQRKIAALTRAQNGKVKPKTETAEISAKVSSSPKSKVEPKVETPPKIKIEDKPIENPVKPKIESEPEVGNGDLRSLPSEIAPRPKIEAIKKVEPKVDKTAELEPKIEAAEKVESDPEIKTTENSEKVLAGKEPTENLAETGKTETAEALPKVEAKVFEQVPTEKAEVENSKTEITAEAKVKEVEKVLPEKEPTENLAEVGSVEAEPKIQTAEILTPIANEAIKNSEKVETIEKVESSPEIEVAEIPEVSPEAEATKASPEVEKSEKVEPKVETAETKN